MCRKACLPDREMQTDLNFKVVSPEAIVDLSVNHALSFTGETEEANDLVVAWLAPPSKNLVNRVDLRSSESARLAIGLVQNQPHCIRHLRGGPTTKNDSASVVRVSGHTSGTRSFF